MVEVTFVATVDDSRMLRLPVDAPLGRVEVVVREEKIVGNGAALLEAIRNTPQTADPTIWKRAREELRRSREEE